MMLYRYLLICLGVLVPQWGFTQSGGGCQCAVTITQSGAYDNNVLNVQPGQTVCVQAGQYTGLSFRNFKGTAAQPIRFVNCGGQVRTGIETGGEALGFSNSSYFIVSGSGDPAVQYGFLANKVRGGASAVGVSGTSTNYEVERVEVAGSGYAGFFMKLDPGCDSMTYQPNYTVRTVKIHDNYIHDTPGTAMFLGSGQSATNGVLITCNGVQKRVYPVQIEGLEVYNNRIEYIGGAAMTVNNAPGASIYNNSILYTNLGAVPAGWQAGGSSACGCDYTVTRAGSYNNHLLRVAPGKTVCLAAGAYMNTTFTNFVGTSAQPIRFVNCGGPVSFSSTSNASCLQFSGSRYFVLSGSGDPAHAYGISLASATAAAALGIGGMSSDCEVDHLEVAQSGFAGMSIKTDPSCDSLTWQANFTMYNVNVHDNYIHDTKGEGIYAGNSFFGTGMTISCSGVQKQVYPHLIYGLDIHHNRIERTGAEGLQYSCAPDAKIHHNELTDTGISPFAYGQNNGIQIGGGAGGDCYSNTIRRVAGMGIIVVGHLGNNRVFNNVISQVGGDGIFCDERPGSLPGTIVQIVNNTISGCVRDGIRLYNQDNINTIANNAITNWGSQGRAITFAQGATASVMTNFTAVSYGTAGYADAASDNFLLIAGSPLINAGTHAAQWGVVADRNDQPRPAGHAYDIGAYEFILAGGNGARAGADYDRPLLPDSAPEGVLAYPLPCVDKLTIQLRTGDLISRVAVYSVQGQLMNQTAMPGQQDTVTLSTATWPAGTYTYQVQAGDRLIRGRVVKL
ncbi:right-handed parallel beta-helix repeat-containing protein [Spirosoma sordidisoli]|uniref:T9SS type A sorting domain-containing protein n=1 Tax=Spirosoma sordidisoli TaxID=2502893 RepID=A0A4Q2USN3_9BACT|nr:right-handed parallel beta-helix repeat-containing protein [Spirosoma sordidisoli]RYC72082.1 T9SS type A sorting domain-containing protein [Spirosoma sordidisoli]